MKIGALWFLLHDQTRVCRQRYNRCRDAVGRRGARAMDPQNKIERDGKELLERAHGLNQLLDEPIRRPVTDNGDVQTATRVEP